MPAEWISSVCFLHEDLTVMMMVMVDEAGFGLFTDFIYGVVVVNSLPLE